MAMQVADLFASLGLKVDKGSWDKGTEVISGIKKGIAAFVGMEAVRAIGDAVMATVDLGGHLDDLRQKTGLTAEALQEYGYVAKLGGSDMDSFAGGVQKLARTLMEAKGGSKEASKALHEVGLTGEAITAALASGDGLDQALMEIASKFADMPDGAKKTALAMSVFGKSGAELIPTLNKGAEGLAELRQEARDLGVVMGEDTVSAADDLGDNIDKVKMSLTGLKNQAISALLPLIKKMVDGFMEWVKANRELIVSTVTKVVHGLVVAMTILGDVIGVIVDVIQYLNEHATLARAVLTAIAIVIAAEVVPALLAMAAGWIAALAPIIAAIAALTAVYLIVNDVMSAILDGKGVTATVVRYIADKFRALGRGILDVFKSIGGFFSGIAGAIKDAFVAVFDWIAAKIEWAIDKVRSVKNFVTDTVFGQPDAIKYFMTPQDGASAGAVAGPTRSMPGAAPAPVVNVNAPTTVTVTGNMPPDWIDTKVDRKIADHHDRVLRDADSSSDGGDE